MWGTLYLVGLKLGSASQREKAISTIVNAPAPCGASTYSSSGQLRHLPFPMAWKRCFGTCPELGTYQNGAFWATPLSYLTKAILATTASHTSLSYKFLERTLGACVDDFKVHGIFEDVDYGRPSQSHGVLNYTASVTNVLWAARQLDTPTSLS